MFKRWREFVKQEKRQAGHTMATPDEDEAAVMDSIEKFTKTLKDPERRGVDDPTQQEIKELAKKFKTVLFRVNVPTTIGGEIVDQYRLGWDKSRTGLRFDCQLEYKYSTQLHKTMVVPAVPYNDMKGVGDMKGVFPSVNANRNGMTWKSLDLRTSGCMILTTQLSGCTFAMGISGTTLYLGHAWPGDNIDGVVLADNIARRSGAIFEAFPGALLAGDIFLIRPVDGTSTRDPNHIGYPRVQNTVNIFGMAFSGKLFVIVQQCDRDSVVEVDLVYYDVGAPGYSFIEF